MRPTLLLLSLSLVLSTTACKKQQAEGTANAAPAPAAPTAKHAAPAEAPTAGGPVKTTPKDLFADFTKPDADGLALLDKYRDGATFTGMIKSAGAEESGRPVLMMDVDGKNIISLDFTEPVPAKAKALKAGDSVTVTCKIGGASGALMMVSDCVL